MTTADDKLPMAPLCTPCADSADRRCCGTGECWLCPLNKIEADSGVSFQNRVEPWMLSCFGAEVSSDRTERSHRFLEEALELVQASGCTSSEAHQLVDYVFGRPVGEMQQEVGGVMVTLAALCLAQGVDMHAAGEVELARVWTKIDVIRAKQAMKPKYSPLPGGSAPNSEAPDDAFHTLRALTDALLRRADTDYLRRQVDAAVAVMASRGCLPPVPWPDEDFGVAVWGRARQAPAPVEVSRLTGEALTAASQFIKNGVELGYIRMPDANTPDSAHDTLPLIERALASLASIPAPIDMVLHCPACGTQHIDAPEEEEYEDRSGQLRMKCDWTNPPHRSHLCHACEHVWRPADVPTNGVAAIKTAGKADSLAASTPLDESLRRWRAVHDELIAEARGAAPAPSMGAPAGWIPDDKEIDRVATARCDNRAQIRAFRAGVAWLLERFAAIPASPVAEPASVHRIALENIACEKPRHETANVCMGLPERMRCYHCGYAWQPDGKPHHAFGCAYIEAVDALAATPASPSPSGAEVEERVCNTCKHMALSENEGACANCGYVAAYDRWEPIAAPSGMAEPVADRTASRQLAEHVLHMEMATERGKRARALARQVLAGHDEALRYLRLIEHATGPGDDDAHHENAHELAQAGIKALAAPIEAEPAAPGANQINDLGSNNDNMPAARDEAEAHDENDPLQQLADLSQEMGLYATPAAEAQMAVAWKPTEAQILAAAEKAGLWPNTIHHWIGAFDRFFDALALSAPTSSAGMEVVGLTPDFSELRNVGALMANTMFNLAQRESMPAHERASFNDMQRRWDEASREFSLAKKNGWRMGGEHG